MVVSGAALGGKGPTEGLIRRQRELAHITELLEEARRGRSGALALRGEPGVGKTALLQAAADAATGFGVVQLRGTAPGAIPTREWPQPLADLLARAVQGAAPARGTRADHRRLGQDRPDEVDEAAVAATCRALERVARFAPPPLLIAVDDAHLLPRWFPGALVRAALEEDVGFAVLVLLAWRDTPHQPAFELGLENVAEHRLGSLDVDGAVQLLQSRGLPLPAPGVAKSMVSATAGIPRALLDVAGRLRPRQRRGLEPLAVPVEVEADLAEAFAPGLAGLSEPARIAVAVAALGVPTTVLAAALDALGSDAAALDEARDAGIVTIRRHRVDFGHPMVRSAAFWLLGQDRRDEVQRAVAEAFWAAGDVERAAIHLGLGQRPPDDLVAQRYGAAADRAAGRGDPRRAAGYQQMAAEFAGTGEQAGDHLARAASLWSTAGAPDAALEVLSTVDGSSLSDHVRAEILYQRAVARFATGVPADAPRAEMIQAAALCAAVSPRRAVVMLVDAAASDLCVARIDGIQELVEQALGLARGVSGFMEALVESVRWITDAGTGGRTRAVPALMGQGTGFPALPHLAGLVGAQLVADGEPEMASRWASWLARSASSSGNRPLQAVAATVTALLALDQGELEDARRAVEPVTDSADVQLSGMALGIASAVHAAAGDYRLGLETTSRLFALPDGASPLTQVAAQVALGTLELGRDRPALATAWLLPAVEEVRAVTPVPSPGHRLPAAWAGALLELAEALVVTGRLDDARAVVALLGSIEEPNPGGTGSLGRRARWLERIISPDADQVIAALTDPRGAHGDLPYHRARQTLLGGVRMAQLGEATRARQHLEHAQQMLDALGAHGLGALAGIELEHLDRRGRSVGSSGDLPPAAPAPAVSAAAVPAAAPTSGRGSTPPTGDGHRGAAETGAEAGTGDPGAPRLLRRRASDVDTRRTRRGQVAGAGPGPTGAVDPGDEPTPGPAHAAPWEIDLLGSVSVRRNGAPVPLPYSLASQALMIVALRRRVPIEELVELLWPDAEPGLGMRRLRNVLWRIRTACGDLVTRDGALIRLDDAAVVDVDEFRRLAHRALTSETPASQASEAARAALGIYQGELLAAERYADWAAGPRESLSRLHIQLLELLLTEAVGADHVQDAFGFVDRLIECDPYNEQHHLVLAELYAKTGNRQRALKVLEQAEAVLDELDLPPSDALKQIRRSINGVIPSGVQTS